MISRFILLLAILLSAACLPASAHAERRVALVVGNTAYANTTVLRNPRNDASDMAEMLKKVGFEVILGLDADQQQFAKLIEDFGRALDEADVGLFFYAGHGLQINEKNYLVSVNAKLNSEFLIPAETIELDAIVRLMESKAPVNLVFLDACRNNPLADNLKRSLASLKRGASLGRGLARVEPSSRDTLVAFAAAPGQEAADGSERNSPFTASLLRHIPQPGLEVSVMLKEVTADVRRDTRNTQRPQQLSDMSKTFYFAKAEAPTPPPAAAPAAVIATLDSAPRAAQAPAPSAPTAAEDRALDVTFWTAVQAANDCMAVRAYLRRFPDGIFIELAKLSESRLCPGEGRNAAAAAAPAGAPTAAPPTRPSRPNTQVAVVKPPAAPAAPDGPEVFRDCEGCPEMVNLVGGSFEMGSSDDPSEKPVHSVSLPAFAIGRYPVTIGEWRLCVAAKACSVQPDGDGNLPVHNISWNDAQAYVKWLSGVSKQAYRLPSEAEWEYAARGGSATKYWWGNTFKVGMGNCKGCGEAESDQPFPIGSFPANPFGLYGMAGGVAEWVADCWSANYTGAPDDGSARDAKMCRERVIRGGSWKNESSYLRTSSRNRYAASIRYVTHGFRVARSR